MENAGDPLGRAEGQIKVVHVTEADGVAEFVSGGIDLGVHHRMEVNERELAQGHARPGCQCDTTTPAGP